MKIKFTPEYTLYEIKVPYIDFPMYQELMEMYPEFDVNDFYIPESVLYVGISYNSKKQQEKLIKKLTKGLKKYYKD